MWLSVLLTLRPETILMHNFKESRTWCGQVWKCFNRTLPFLSLECTYKGPNTMAGWPFGWGGGLHLRQRGNDTCFFLISRTLSPNLGTFLNRVCEANQYSVWGALHKQQTTCVWSSQMLLTASSVWHSSVSDNYKTSNIWHVGFRN